MSEVVELRVHGVGGTPPEAMLGETSNASLIRVAGSNKDGFYARLKQPSVEGYSWGKLTSGKWAQVFWIFLLPFTLVNIAGWALPPRRPSTERMWEAGRVAVALLGLALTTAYAFGAYSLVTKRLFYQWKLSGLIGSDTGALWLGSAVVVVLGIIIYRWSLDRQRKFEGVTVGISRDEAKDEGRGILQVLLNHEALDSQEFWARQDYARQFLRLHMVVALLAVTILTLWGQRSLDRGETLSLQGPFVWLGLVNAALLIAILVASWRGYHGADGAFVQGQLRALRPFALASLGVALAGGIIAGLAMLLDRALPGEGGGPELNLNLPFGLTALTLVVALAATLLFLLWRSRSVLERTKHEPPLVKVPPAGTEPTGVASLARVKLFRSLSDAGRHADVALVCATLVFVLSGTGVLAAMLFSGPGNETGLGETVVETIGGQRAVAQDAVEAVSARAPFGIELGSLAAWGRIASVLTLVGGWLLLTFASRLLLYLRKGPKNLALRRNVGILWDVFSFFPRRFHPLAVRPYAERAVPQLRGRLEHHLQNGRWVILSTHSQGTVLGYAALQQLTPADRRKVSFVTYGTPLTQLHARFFPTLFKADDYSGLRNALYDGPYDGIYSRSWCNFYRLSDYIGKELWFRERNTWGPPLEDPHNVIVSDPGEDLLSGRDIADAWPGTPDPMRVPFDSMALHSYYNSEKLLKDHLVKLREGMSRPPQEIALDEPAEQDAEWS